MAIATTMNINRVDINANTNTNTDPNTNTNTNKQQQQQQQQQDQEEHQNEDDEHEHDMVMPGFRFHPTEEELIEFYLRRKVEGKRFNVELITFLDLYRYDPWELPALAAIGEKEWFFYVPRDRKYRNGDRPNRVTTTGYWKATGADRMIRGENSRPIGLKKTLVFYSGKAPKGIRTSWIMNEYRLPHHETERYQKAEISLCRVYKRPGVEDHPSASRTMSRLSPPSRATSSSSERKNHLTAFRAQSSSLHHQHQQVTEQHQLDKVTETDTSSSTEVGTALGLSQPPPPPPQPSFLVGHSAPIFLGDCSTNNTPNHTNNSSNNNNSNHQNQPNLEEIQRLVEYQQAYHNHHFHHQQPPYENRQQQLQFEALTSNPSSSNNTTNSATNFHLFSNYLPPPLLNNNVIAPPMVGGSIGLQSLLPPVSVAASSGVGPGLWEWNPFPDPNRDHFSNLFK